MITAFFVDLYFTR